MAKISDKISGLFFQKEEDDDLGQFEGMLGNTSINQYPDLSESVIVDTNNISTAEAIYKENGIDDLSNSIFKVEEIKGALPTNLPNEIKKASVIGMMGVSKLAIETVLEDAEKRSQILSGALQKFTDETVNIIEQGQGEIAELEEKINSINEKITARKKNQDDQEKVVTDEISKITSIVNFIK